MTGKTDMTQISRRAFALTSLAGLGALAACGNGIGSRGPSIIDARVRQTLDHLYSNYPATRELRDDSEGQLVMPLITEAGFGFGGGYGRGALQVDGTTVDYYSATKGSFGLQIGALQYAHVLFFMTDEALMRFRRSEGWAVGGDVKYAFNDVGENLRAETTTITAPVVAVIFGQAGLQVGATLDGVKYTRIIP